MGSLLKRLRERTRIRPLPETIVRLARWYATPLGQDILRSQKRILADQLSYLFGYHLMQLSVVPDQKLYFSSRINHCFSLSPVELEPGRDRQAENRSESRCVQALAEYESLPFEDEVIDVALLHHVLEFSDNPQHVLKEAARVTIPNGYIVLVGFNPFSLIGLIKPFAQFFDSSVIWHRNNLRVGRIRDWLEFLDFTCQEVRYTTFNLPINNKKYLTHSRFIRRLFIGRGLPFGGTYCLVARKDKVGLTPIKPKWEPKRFMDVVPIPKSSAPVRRSATILPLRKRNYLKKGI